MGGVGGVHRPCVVFNEDGCCANERPCCEIISNSNEAMESLK